MLCPKCKIAIQVLTGALSRMVWITCTSCGFVFARHSPLAHIAEGK